MKRIETIIVLLVFFLCSCDETWYYEYVIANDTDYHVTIEAYDKDEDIDGKSFSIKPHSEHVEIKAFGFQHDYQGIFMFEIDSVRISFDNSKIIIQSCEQYLSQSPCDFDRDIVDYNNSENYVKTKNGKSQGNQQYRYTYTITEDDYNNAVPIED